MESLRNLFTYDPDTGVLTWARGRNKGKDAGYPTSNGYLRVKIGQTHYRVHRIIWKLYHGADIPDSQQIDHINRDRTDNRIGNLRVVTASENNRNQGNRKGRPGAARHLADLASIPIIIRYPDGRTLRAESLRAGGVLLGIGAGTLHRYIQRGTHKALKRLRGIRVEYATD